MGLSFIGLRLVVLALFQNPVLIFLLQLMHGLTFALVWIAGIHYVSDNAPPSLQATSQAIFGGVMMNLGSAIGNFTGGALMERFSTAEMYGIMGAAVLFGLLIFSLLGGVKPSRAKSSPEEEPVTSL